MTIFPPDGSQTDPSPTTLSEPNAIAHVIVGAPASTESVEAGETDPHGQSCLTQLLKLSFGQCANDNRPSARTLSLGELIQEFSNPNSARGTLTAAEYHALDKVDSVQKAQRNREKDGAYFVACHFGGDGRRCNDNVEALCGMTLDFDSGKTTEEDIRRQLRGYAYLAYTSYSHRVELQKWRVLVPYREPITKDQHAGVFRYFQDLFQGDVDPACATPCQFWYTPACPPDATSLFRSFAADGDLFAPAAIHEDPAPVRGPAPDIEAAADSADHSDRLQRLEAALRFIPSDDRKTWVNFGIAIKHDLGDSGLAPWLAWSRKSEKFDVDDALKTWGSFKDKLTGPSITLGSIFYMAQERGWNHDAPGAELPEYVTRLNADYFHAPQGGKTLVFKEQTDPLSGREFLQAMSLKDFRDLFTSDRVDVCGANGRPKSITVADAWLLHKEHRQFDGVILAPNAEVPGYYNLWRGFAVEPHAGDWNLMRSHIRNVLCKGDPIAFEYFLSWLASCVQYPDRRAEVAVVLRGGRGTGKGIFVHTIGRIFGQHYLQISQPRHLTGNFNAHLAECVVLFVDEAFWAGDKPGEGVLKHLITEPTLPIERKFRDVESTRNLLHVLMASNNQWVVPAGLEERRFFVLDVDDSKQQDHKYFGALSAEIESGGTEAMLHELLHRDISSFNFRAAPKTKALTDQKLLSMDPADRWWFEVLTRGVLPIQNSRLAPRGTQYEVWDKIPINHLHADYVKNQKMTNTPRRSSQTQLGISLKRLLPAGFPKKGTVTELDYMGVACRVPVYKFPPLEACRKYFEGMASLDGFDWEGADLSSDRYQPEEP